MLPKADSLPPKVQAVPGYFRHGVVAVVALLLLNLAGYLLLQNNEPWRIFVSDLIAVVGPLAAVGALCYADYKSRKLSTRLALAWRILALASLLYAIGEAIDLYQNLVDLDTFGSWSDAFFLSYYVVFIVGLFMLPSRRLERGELSKLMLEMGIVIIASAQIFWVFFFAPSLATISNDITWLELTLTLAYPAMDLALLWVVTTLFLRQPHTAQQGPLLLLGLSVIAMCLGDTLYNWYETVLNDSHHYWPMIAFNVSWLLAILAGVLHGDSVRAQPINQEERLHMTLIGATPNRRRRFTFYLPYLFVAVSFFLLVRSLLQVDFSSQMVDVLIEVVGVGLILMLVVCRQIVAFRENAVLSLKLTRLLEASHILASPLELRPLLRLTLSELKNVVDFDSASIMLSQHAKDVNPLDIRKNEVSNKRPLHQVPSVNEIELLEPSLMVLNYDQLDDPNARPIACPNTQQLNTVLHTGKTVILPNIPLRLAQAINGVVNTNKSSELSDNLVSWMGIPLISRNKVIGLLTICFYRANYYTHQDAGIALTFGNQTAAAIDNARLRASERAAAAIAERSRLARELHDSVSQALFGISLGAKTARELLKENPVRAGDSLDYVVKLTAGALAEMRALIFELRPESLATEGLVNALKRQVHVLFERHSLEADIEVIGNDHDISLDVQQGLYRIALEAVQNTIKHANATRAIIRLNCQSDFIIAEIQDNGRGFDNNGAFPGHLGLISMRERAEYFGGQLEIQSVPSQGTTVRVTMPRYARALEAIEGI